MKILKNYQALRYIVIVMALEIVAISINFFLCTGKSCCWWRNWIGYFN